jgi:hypothetical protein
VTASLVDLFTEEALAVEDAGLDGRTFSQAAVDALGAALRRYAAAVDVPALDIERKQSIVYYLRRPDDGAIKIGWSTFLLVQFGRFDKLARTFPGLELLAWEAGGLPEERERHREFHHHRMNYLRDEWFRPGPDLLAHIAALRGIGQPA